MTVFIAIILLIVFIFFLFLYAVKNIRTLLKIIGLLIYEFLLLAIVIISTRSWGLSFELFLIWNLRRSIMIETEWIMILVSLRNLLCWTKTDFLICVRSKRTLYIFQSIGTRPVFMIVYLVTFYLLIDFLCNYCLQDSLKLHWSFITILNIEMLWFLQMRIGLIILSCQYLYKIFRTTFPDLREFLL